VTKIGSIYVEVRGDYTQFQKDLREVRSTAKASGKEISDALGNAMSSGQASKGVTDLSRNLMQLSATAKVPGENFKTTARQISEGLSAVAQKTGMTQAEFAKLNERMLRTQAQQNAERSLRGIARSANLSAKEVRALAIQMGFSAQEADKMTANITRARNSTDRLIGSLKGIAGPLIGITGASGALYKAVGLFRDGTMELAQWERRLMRTEALLRSTGHAAGLTVKELSDFAKERDLATLGSKDDILDSINALQSFRSIQGDTFKQTIRLAQDMSSVFGTDLRSATMQLGKALEDPIQGLTALRRSGVSFTEAQRDMIKEMVESNRLLEAQTTILDMLEQQVGGAAEGEAGGLLGKLDSMSFHWRELKESLAQTDMAVEGVDRITAAIIAGTKAIKAYNDEQERSNRLRAGGMQQAQGGGLFGMLSPGRLLARMAANRATQEVLPGQVDKILRPDPEIRQPIMWGNIRGGSPVVEEDENVKLDTLKTYGRKEPYGMERGFWEVPDHEPASMDVLDRWYNDFTQKNLDRLDQLRDLAKSEMDLEQERHAQRLEWLMAASDEMFEYEGERHAILEELEEQHQDRMREIREKGLTDLEKFTAMSWKSQADTVFSEMANITAGVAQHNKAMFQVNKVAGIANAIISTHEGVAKTLSKYPWPLAGAMAAVHLAAGMARVSAIASTSYGGGGKGSAPSIAGTTPAPPVSDVGTARPQNVTLALSSDRSRYTREEISEILNGLNDLLRDGGQIARISLA
jgi:hypothetical protein